MGYPEVLGYRVHIAFFKIGINGYGAFDLKLTGYGILRPPCAVSIKSEKYTEKPSKRK